MRLHCHSYVDLRPGDCAAAQPICILYNLDSPSKGVTQVLYDCAALLARRLCEEPSLLGSKAGKAEHGTSKALGMMLDLLEPDSSASVVNGKEDGNYYSILGSYRDNGKENGNYYSILGVI